VQVIFRIPQHPQQQQQLLFFDPPPAPSKPAVDDAASARHPPNRTRWVVAFKRHPTLDATRHLLGGRQ